MNDHQEAVSALPEPSRIAGVRRREPATNPAEPGRHGEALRPVQPGFKHWPVRKKNYLPTGMMLVSTSGRHMPFHSLRRMRAFWPLPAVAGNSMKP